ncbi:MAG TPA: hypothetical protein VJ204_08095 [Solirubrobacterales bacterium]|nr:hypothetical protein [Solirubrobacterales bacterium]
MEKDEIIYGTAEDISKEHAFYAEHGCVLMFRDMTYVYRDEVVEAVPARLGAENGGRGLSIRVGDHLFFARLDEFETAFEDPAPSSGASEWFAGDAEPKPEEGEALRQPGSFSAFRYAKEITGEDLFQPVAAKLCADGTGLVELLIWNERYLFRRQDFWDALVDPRTFRIGDDSYGPDPIDALRGSVGGDGA